MSYPGGKNGSGVYQQIINRIPPHQIYVEPFLGGGAVLRMKRPAEKSIVMDRDLQVIKKFDLAAVPNLTLLVGDAFAWLKHQAFTSSTFVYLDPPYLMESRHSHRKIYSYELSESDHRVLLGIIRTLPAMVMISGYPNDIYDALLWDWWTATFQTTNRGGHQCTEKLWMNYPEPILLHDYRYLGGTFRERERIKKKKKRWTERIMKLPDLERYALATAISDVTWCGQLHQKRRAAPVTTAVGVLADCGGMLTPKVTNLLKALKGESTNQDPITKRSGTRSTRTSRGDESAHDFIPAGRITSYDIFAGGEDPGDPQPVVVDARRSRRPDHKILCPACEPPGINRERIDEAGYVKQVEQIPDITNTSEKGRGNARKYHPR